MEQVSRVKLAIALTVVLVIVALFTTCFLACTSPSESSPSSSPSSVSIDTSPEAQQRRAEIIDELIEKGIFYKVEKPGDIPRVWVTPTFHLLDFDDKEIFIGVVAAYYFAQNPQWDIVTLYDSKTGKQIGVFAEVYGGLKLD